MMPMTEEQWLACKNPDTMLDFAWDNQGKISNRKLRLFAMLCCRQVWDLLDVRSRHAVEIAERYAEGLATPEEMDTATNNAENAADDASAKWYEGDESAANALLSAAEAAACGVGAVGGGVSTSSGNRPTSVNRWARLAAEQVIEALTWKSKADVFDDGRAGPARRIVCDLFRHIVGNPFRDFPRACPSTVVQLAEALRAGQDCAFALHDALLEAGQAEIAEHFLKETAHPKGCWAMDVILGKA
jgi:hypothetical protein